MSSVIWSENAPFPDICEYHQYGCSCGSPVGLTAEDLKDGDHQSRCDYCESRVGDECQCCECECECEEDFIIDAKSFNDWVRETCYVCDPNCFDSSKISSDACVKHLGAYHFYLKYLPETVVAYKTNFLGLPIGKGKIRQTKLKVFSEEGIRRYISFDGPVLVPVLAKNDEVWMSLTPNEIYSMRDVLEDVAGRVMIAGLGMGWLTNRICELPSVTEVIQIEIDPDIIEFFGKPLLQKHSKLTIVQDDAYRFVEANAESWDAILFDIWPRVGDSSYDSRFKQIQKKFRHKGTYVWGWADIR